MRPGALLGIAAAAAMAALSLAACATVEGSAAKDPMKCERDPACAKARGSYVDCTRSCNDDPECMRRCDEVKQYQDNMGH